MADLQTNNRLNVVCVADGRRISLALALHLIVSRKTNPALNYHIAIPRGSKYDHPLAEEVIKECATSIFEIPEPTTYIDGKIYRIENKINALKYFDNTQAILIDSDLFFLRGLPVRFIMRSVPTAVPEHGLHNFPWARMYETLSLKNPEIVTILGSGEMSPPWLNAGFVCVPNAEKFGHQWAIASKFVLDCDWVPERWPYLDQISLPLAMAMYSESKTVDYANILPSQFNDNIFYWHSNQSYASNSFVIHHHYRVGLLRRYIPNVLTWVSDGDKRLTPLLDDLKPFDDEPNPK